MPEKDLIPFKEFEDFTLVDHPQERVTASLRRYMQSSRSVSKVPYTPAIPHEVVARRGAALEYGSVLAVAPDTTFSTTNLPHVRNTAKRLHTFAADVAYVPCGSFLRLRLFSGHVLFCRVERVLVPEPREAQPFWLQRSLALCRLLVPLAGGASRGDGEPRLVGTSALFYVPVCDRTVIASISRIAVHAAAPRRAAPPPFAALPCTLMEESAQARGGVSVAFGAARAPPRPSAASPAPAPTADRAALVASIQTPAAEYIDDLFARATPPFRSDKEESAAEPVGGLELRPPTTCEVGCAAPPPRPSAKQQVRKVIEELRAVGARGASAPDYKPTPVGEAGSGVQRDVELLGVLEQMGLRAARGHCPGAIIGCTGEPWDAVAFPRGAPSQLIFQDALWELNSEAAPACEAPQGAASCYLPSANCRAIFAGGSHLTCSVCRRFFPPRAVPFVTPSEQAHTLNCMCGECLAQSLSQGLREPSRVPKPDLFSFGQAPDVASRRRWLGLLIGLANMCVSAGALGEAQEADSYFGGTFASFPDRARLSALQPAQRCREALAAWDDKAPEKAIIILPHASYKAVLKAAIYIRTHPLPKAKRRPATSSRAANPRRARPCVSHHDLQRCALALLPKEERTASKKRTPKARRKPTAREAATSGDSGSAETPPSPPPKKKLPRSSTKQQKPSPSPSLSPSSPAVAAPSALLRPEQPQETLALILRSRASACRGTGCVFSATAARRLAAELCAPPRADLTVAELVQRVRFYNTTLERLGAEPDASTGDVPGPDGTASTHLYACVHRLIADAELRAIQDATQHAATREVSISAGQREAARTLDHVKRAQRVLEQRANGLKKERAVLAHKREGCRERLARLAVRAEDVKALRRRIPRMVDKEEMNLLTSDMAHLEKQRDDFLQFLKVNL